MSVSVSHAPFAVKVPCVWPFVISVVFAATDEYHQTFVAGRAGRFSDVIIDSSGAIFGIAFAFAVILLLKKRIKAERGA